MSKLLKIVYGERIAWEGSVEPDSTITVSAASLYGGTDTGGSGGISGTFYLNGGDSGQGRDPVVQAFLGTDEVPAHRGIVTLSMGSTYTLKNDAYTLKNTYADGAYVSAYSAYFRGLYCKVQNLGYDWYPSKGTIADTEINPAHEIRDALINPDLSGQYSADDLDEDSFIAAADTLYSENFGLSPVWSDTSTSQEYIDTLLKHIDGTLNRDRTTGKLRLRLNRCDYDEDDLITLSTGDYSEVSSLGALALTSTVNKLTITYVRMTDVGEEDGTMTAENIANIALQDGYVSANSDTFEFCTDAIEDLPSRILLRELHAASYPLKSFTLKGYSEKMNALQEGDVFILNFPEAGIEKLVSRVMEADYGTLDDHTITLTCSEDIYGTDIASVVISTGTSWESPFVDPTKPVVYVMYEAPLYLAKMTDGYESTMLTSYPKGGVVFSLAERSNSLDTYYSHNIYDDDTGWTSVGDGQHASSTYLFLALGKKDTVLSVYDVSSIELAIGNLLFVGTEIMSITAFTDTTITVLRGVLDTLPQDHAQGARVWLPAEDQGGYCDEMFTEGDTAKIALTTTNTVGTSTPLQADLTSTAMNARIFRPMPPAYLLLNNSYLPETCSGIIALSWYHRCRLEQQDVVVSQDAGDIGPEDGTTYTIKFYSENGELVKTASGITDNFYTWSSELADSGLAVWDTTALTGDAMPCRYNSDVTVELYSERDGYASYQSWSHGAARNVGEINAPTITGVNDGATGVALNPVITVGAFASSVDESPVTVNNVRIRWTVGNTVYEEFHTLSANGGTITATTELPHSTSVSLECTWAGQTSGAGNSTTISFETLMPVIFAPVFTEPSDEVESGTITAAVNAMTHNLSSSYSHTATSWMASSDADGEVILQESVENGTDLRSHTFTDVVDEGETVYLWAKFHVGELESEWASIAVERLEAEPEIETETETENQTEQ
ncbi:MAG: hypothetical protein R3Y11_00425 [Pseudomonadota bacterium]